MEPARITRIELVAVHRDAEGNLVEGMPDGPADAPVVRAIAGPRED